VDKKEGSGEVKNKREKKIKKRKKEEEDQVRNSHFWLHTAG